MKDYKDKVAHLLLLGAVLFLFSCGKGSPANSRGGKAVGGDRPGEVLNTLQSLSADQKSKGQRACAALAKQKEEIRAGFFYLLNVKNSACNQGAPSEYKVKALLEEGVGGWDLKAVTEGDDKTPTAFTNQMFFEDTRPFNKICSTILAGGNQADTIVDGVTATKFSFAVSAQDDSLVESMVLTATKGMSKDSKESKEGGSSAPTQNGFVINKKEIFKIYVGKEGHYPTGTVVWYGRENLCASLSQSASQKTENLEQKIESVTIP